MNKWRGGEYNSRRRVAILERNSNVANEEITDVLKRYVEARENYLATTRHPSRQNLTIGRPEIQFLEIIDTHSLALARTLDVPGNVDLWEGLSQLAGSHLARLREAQSNGN